MFVRDMEQFKREVKGFTLLELVIAIALSAVVLLSASNLLINFGKFSANVVRSEASLMGTSLGAFEEITRRINIANKAAINPAPAMDVPATAYPAGCVAGSCIQIRVDTASPATASVFTDDTVYTYWLNAGNLRRTGVTGDPVGGTAIAGNITSLSFTRPGTSTNAISIVLEAQAASGPKSETSKEHLETTAIMRSRSANLS